MKKNILLLCVLSHSLLFSSEKQWVNKKEFRIAIERLIRKCINLEIRLLQEGKSEEEVISLVLKTHDSRKLLKLREKNPQFEEIIQLAFKKYQE